MRPAHALIDLSALRHNYQLAKSLSGCRAFAVIKANAYGHGAVRAASALLEMRLRCERRRAVCALSRWRRERVVSRSCLLGRNRWLV